MAKYEYRIIEAEMKNFVFNPVPNEALLTGYGIEGFRLVRIEKDAYMKIWFYLEKVIED